MSWDDKMFMAQGYRVRHKYVKKRKCHARCELCGVKRKRANYGQGRIWLYLKPDSDEWTASNPPCAKKKPKPTSGGGHPGPFGGPGSGPWK